MDGCVHISIDPAIRAIDTANTYLPIRLGTCSRKNRTISDVWTSKRTPIGTSYTKSVSVHLIQGDGAWGEFVCVLRIISVFAVWL